MTAICRSLVGLAGLLVVSAAQAEPQLHCTVLLDQETGKALLREGECDRRLPPASTFKVPLAVIGFEAGVLKNETEPRWPYRAEYDAPKRVRKDVDPTIWEHDSVLWYSREITRRLGEERFVAGISALGYGNGDVSGDAGKNNSLTHSWLSSSLQISGDEQAAFVRRLVRDELPVSKRAMALSRAVLPEFKAGEWTVKGKTGSIWLRKKNGTFDRTKPAGWFVGWAQKDERKVVFATVSVGRETDGPSGPAERDLFLKQLPRLLAVD